MDRSNTLRKRFGIELSIKFFTKVAAWTIVWIIVVYAASYTSLYYTVYREDSEILGLYNPLIDGYLCKTYNTCIHEQGHSVDAHGALLTIFLWDWRSTEVSFQQDVDTIFSCMQVAKQNNSDSRQRNLAVLEVFATIDYLMQNGKETTKYQEIYASTYRIMKIHRWDIYQYQDVEDMISQKAEYCQTILDDIIANYD